MRSSVARFSYLTRLEQDMQAAMRAKDSCRLNVVRAIRSRVTYKTKEPGAKAADDALVVLVLREYIGEVDKTVQELSSVNTDRAKELVKQATDEKKILMEYMPAQMSEQDLANEVRVVVKENGGSGIKDMKRLLPLLQKRVEGKADPKMLGKLLKDVLEMKKD